MLLVVDGRSLSGGCHSLAELQPSRLSRTILMFSSLPLMKQAAPLHQEMVGSGGGSRGIRSRRRRAVELGAPSGDAGEAWLRGMVPAVAVLDAV